MVDTKKMEELDAHWNEIMDLAVKYGFIVQAYGGVSIVMTHKRQLEMWGAEKYLHRQKEMHRNDMEAHDNG